MLADNEDQATTEVAEISPPQTTKDTVMVGISGGVDSSVAALLLKERGYAVVGVTFWLWNYSGSPEYRGKNNACCSFDHARLVADQLGIDHYRTDIGERFKREVFEPTVQDYLSGRTPNPCALCNRYIRFDYVMNQAKQAGFDFFATGHHVRKAEEGDTYRLLRGKDGVKDQSYFLYSLGQDELSQALFPIGDFRKEEIYGIARDHGLVSAEVAESQDLCFVSSSEDYRQVIEQVTGQKIEAGEFVDTEGNILGKHQGLSNYTIGQRRGLGLETNEAMYVLTLDSENNRIIVGPEEELYSEGLLARDCQWIS
ncbi:MAG: tRNA 2-thiouridine(34) synthase MnmA, partial [Candidatus Acetothermia bacterium]